MESLEHSLKILVGNRAALLALSMFYFLLPAANVAAQQAGHTPLARSSTLSFQEVLSAAIKNAPETLERDVRSRQVDSFKAIAGSWVADRPVLVVNYLDDRILEDIGQREFEYAIQLELRRPAERRSSRLLSESYKKQARAWELALQLYIAGRVRRSLADMTEADIRLELEKEVTRNTEHLLSTSRNLQDVGELSQLDVMQVEALLLSQQQTEMKVEALLVDAERNYEVLTGLHVRPDFIHKEKLSERHDIEPSHPQLANLQSNIDLAEVNIQMARAGARGAPVVTLGITRQREDFLQQNHDAITFSLSIPFGGKNLVDSKSSFAAREKVGAEVSYQNTLRKLDLALHEVEHELFLTSEAIKLAEKKSALSQRQWQMSKTAFAQGEINLSRVIVALQEYRQAQKQYRLLTFTRERLITEFNQTIGILP